jgi:hypothetical protein
MFLTGPIQSTKTTLLSDSSRDTPGKDFLDEFGDTFGFGRTRHDGVDGDCRALGELGKTAGQ